MQVIDQKNSKSTNNKKNVSHQRKSASHRPKIIQSIDQKKLHVIDTRNERLPQNKQIIYKRECNATILPGIFIENFLLLIRE